MDTQFISTISEEPSWLMSNLWWLSLVGILLMLQLIFSGAQWLLIGLFTGLYIWATKPNIDLSTPEAAVLGFSKAMGKLDIEFAKHYATTRGQEVLTALDGLIEMVPPNAKKEALEESKNLRLSRCNIIGNRATCLVCCKADGSQENSPLYLIRDINENWEVDFTKDGAAQQDSFPPLPQ